MPKTIVIRDSTINELVLGDKHIHHHTSNQEEPKEEPKREVQDVEFEEVQGHFCYISPLCKELKMVDFVENCLRAACIGTAEDLWTCIHKYEGMGYLITSQFDATKIYRAITDYFGPLKYGERQFRKVREK